MIIRSRGYKLETISDHSRARRIVHSNAGQRGPSQSESEFGVGVWPFCRHFLPPRQTGRGAVGLPVRSGVGRLGAGSGSGSASRSRVHMFRHSPDFQFKKRTPVCGFYRIQERCGKLLRLQRDRGGRGLRPFPQNGYENNSLVER